MGRVLGIVYRAIATHLIRSAGFSRDHAQTGAVTLIQRFGSAVNLNVHFHMLFLDGVYVERSDGRLRFRWVKAPTSAELTAAQQHETRRGWPTRSPAGSVAFWSDRVCWSAMPRIAGWSAKTSTTIP